jgi:hypothetical protein
LGALVPPPGVAYLELPYEPLFVAYFEFANPPPFA